MNRLFPLFLKLENRKVLLVGAGQVGTRKALELLEAGAKLHVVATQASETVRDWASQGKLSLEERHFTPEDLKGCWLVIAATNQSTVNKQISEACETAHLFVNAIDDPAHASVYAASTIERDPFTIAISSSGELPALSKLIREVLESVIPAPHWIEAARALRRQWKEQKTPMEKRFPELVQHMMNRDKT